MIAAIILIILVGGIVYAARRWPDIERRFFGGADAPAVTPAAVPEAEPEAASTPIAKGFMSKKPITTEPEVEPDDFHKTQVDERPQPVADAPVPDETPTTDEPTPPAYSPPAADQREAHIPPPDSEPAPTPGGHVTGAPARPSEPAYVNATTGVDESVDDLAAEADQAYRDRDYERAEQACLKILMREPKNHKYMTRIGQVYQEMGNLEDAKEAFESAKKLDPKNFFVLNRLAEVERMLADPGGRKAAHQEPKED